MKRVGRTRLPGTINIGVTWVGGCDEGHIPFNISLRKNRFLLSTEWRGGNKNIYKYVQNDYLGGVKKGKKTKNLRFTGRRMEGPELLMCMVDFAPAPPTTQTQCY
jgi:hypothetical protein